MYYYLFILAVGIERLVELAVAQRNAKWSFARGGKEFGRDHYPAMVSMHALLLVSSIVEVWALGRPFVPWLGWSMLAVVVFSTVVRWRCVTVLGKRWNPRLIVIPGAPLVGNGLTCLINRRRTTTYVAATATFSVLGNDRPACLAVKVSRWRGRGQRIPLRRRPCGPARFVPRGAGVCRLRRAIVS
jgi:methyltransferase